MPAAEVGSDDNLVASPYTYRKNVTQLFQYSNKKPLIVSAVSYHGRRQHEALCWNRVTFVFVRNVREAQQGG